MQSTFTKLIDREIHQLGQFTADLYRSNAVEGLIADALSWIEVSAIT